MQPFQQGLPAPIWQHVLVIVGAILTPRDAPPLPLPSFNSNGFFAESVSVRR
jgi:hypothetical protein